jgi:diguanylate cyclase (GGDEF)-like protein
MSVSLATLPSTLRRTRLLRDSRTALLNFEIWNRKAAAEVTRAVRTKSPLAVAIIDLDFFGLVNEAHGHMFGDEVLCQVGQCLRALLRDYDLVARRGQEFIVLLPSTRTADAFRIAERVRWVIARQGLQAPDGALVQITVSVGVAGLDVGSRRELHGLLSAADAALYLAKRYGRNQVQMISTTRGVSAVAAASQGTAAPAEWPPATRGVRREADFVPMAENTAASTAVRLLTVAAHVLPTSDRSRYAEEFSRRARRHRPRGQGALSATGVCRPPTHRGLAAT